MNKLHKIRHSIVIAAFVIPTTLSSLAFAAATDIATGPLITPGASTVRPNLFFILDNSGSMNWDYLPDWVVDSNWCKGSTGKATMKCCRNSGGDTITSSSTSSTCLPQNSSSGLNLDSNGLYGLRGMPPFHTAEFNSAYYNPDITYMPPLKHDGDYKTPCFGNYTSTNVTCSNSPGNVPWNGYYPDVSGAYSNTINLTTGFPDIQWCTDATYTDCLRNDNYLLPGTINGKSYTTMRSTYATGSSQAYVTGTPSVPSTRTGNVGPYYYVMVAGEYCTTPKLTDCISATGQTTSGGKTYLYPATLRWCNNSDGRVSGEPGASAGNACQAVKNSTYQYARYPTLKLADGVSAAVSWGRVTVNGTPNSGTVTLANFVINNSQPSQINLFGGTSLVWSVSGSTSTNRRNNLASAIVAKINANSGTTGFSAVLDNASDTGRLRINGPLGTTYNGASVTVDGDLLGTSATTVTTNTTMSRTTSFANGINSMVATYAPGSFKRFDVISGVTFKNLCIDISGNLSETTSNTCSGTMVVDRSNRTDCASRPTCSYSEEITNFANWFVWYRNRIQLAKTALSISFQSVDDRYRVGYFTLNDSSSNLVNISDFNLSQKSSWYGKLFSAKPDGSTPLRQALANAGRIFGGKTAITGALDPVQYSCQKNYSILSTDGYWNSNNGKRIDGTSDIGEEDYPNMVVNDGDGDPTKYLTISGNPYALDKSASLADVAAYYYKTDLRSTSLSNCTGALSSSVCANDVPTTSEDLNRDQHMVTFTIGLGIDGVMKFRANYTESTTDATDDYTAVKDGTTANPSAGICPWQSSGTCNWPDPQTGSSSEIQERIDDLWHAAVNGHGKYYSARDARALGRGIRDALTGIGKDDGGGAAATTSNPNVTTGDNFVFSSKYWTKDWTGELYRQTIDPAGNISTTPDWKAHDLLDTASWSGRNVYTFVEGGGNPRDFKWSSLKPGGCTPPTNEQGCFVESYITSGLMQFCTFGPDCLSVPDKAAASGQTLVDYVRGDKSNEDTTTTAGYYRERKHRLGDIVNSEAVYVGKYLFDFGASEGYPSMNTDKNYPSVYVGSNDGMLHAFNAGPNPNFNATNDTNYGGERWTYVPSMVIGNLHRLADKDYATKHRFFVDGTPVTAEVKDSGIWKTLVVGGLASGGAGYYALDVTDQSAPKVLWEFRQKSGCTATVPTGASRYSSSGISRMTEDCDLGYSFGNPIITKLPNGTWVVLVTSGYNNHSGGDGKGYLYVLNAIDGSILYKVTTGAGTTTTPSGLGKINGWVDEAMKNNTTKYVYGGDLLGNMWKFDMTSSPPTKSLLISVGNSKPITAKPELGEIVKTNGQKKRVVFFPTGRLLGNSDLADASAQSFFGVWDAEVGSPSTLVPVTVSVGGAGRIGVIYDTNGDGSSDSVFDDDTNLGWKLDFPENGERGNTDPFLAFGTVVFSTNKPTTPDPCNPSGFSSWVYNVDYRSGGVVYQPGDTNTHLATYHEGAATRPNVVVLPSGIVKSITRVSGQEVQNFVEDVRINTTSGGARRVSWRELLN